MRIRFTPTARREFLDAITYIRRDNPEAARRFRKRAEKILRRLEQFPENTYTASGQRAAAFNPSTDSHYETRALYRPCTLVSLPQVQVTVQT